VEAPKPAPASRADAGAGDEFAVIGRLRAAFESAARTAPGSAVPRPGETWIGDDAAVVVVDTGRVVVATDSVVEGVHVEPGLSGPADVGYKALMASLSDLAAMGASPSCAVVAVTAPSGCDLDGLGEGLAAAARDAACPVVGGDLSGGPVLVVTATVLGALGGGDGTGPLLRSGALAGDTVFVTGPLGASAAGLRLLRAGAPLGAEGAELADRHRRPVARLAEGRTARLAGATAAVDVSDGFLADLVHVAEASGVGVALDEVPVCAGASPEEALDGGEDYELILTTGDPARLVAAFGEAGLRPPVAVGRCTGTPGELTLAGRAVRPAGWRHRF
jgi:thiamine-monophosphate kinase